VLIEQTYFIIITVSSRCSEVIKALLREDEVMIILMFISEVFIWAISVTHNKTPTNHHWL